METISIILIFIMLASPLLLITALIKPSILWQKNRLHACGSYVVFVFFVMTGSILAHMMVPLTEQQIAERSIAKQEQIEQQEQAKQDEIAIQEQIKRDEIAKQEQAKQDEIIKDLQHVSVFSYKEKTKAERIAFISDLIKYSDRLPKRDAGLINMLRKKYGVLKGEDMNDLYNAISKKLVLIPIDFKIRSLIRIIGAESAGFVFDPDIREKNIFDAVLKNEFLIWHEMEAFIKSQMNDPDSFKMVKIDKQLNGDLVTFIMTYRGKNAYNATVTEQLPVNVSIATGMIVE